jgi:SH3-like domain-containing protein
MLAADNLHGRVRKIQTLPGVRTEQETMRANLPIHAACALAVLLAAGPAAAQQEGRGSVTNLPLPRFVSMRAEKANARRGPNLNQRVDWEFLHRGAPLEVTAEYGQWRRVRDADGAGGWVHHSLLSGVRTALVRADAPVPLRAGPNDKAAVRAIAEPGVVGRLEACSGGWCEIAADGFSGWLPRDTIWGVGADESFE